MISYKFLFSKSLILSLLLSGAQAQDVVVVSFAPDATYNGGPNENSDGPNGSIFSNISGLPISFGMGNGNAADFGPVTLTDVASGTTQDFNIEISVSTNNTTATNPVQRGGVGATGVSGGTTNTLIDPGETLTLGSINLIPVSGTLLFRFDGYRSVFFGNTTSGESATANGETFTATSTAGGTSFNEELTLPALAPTIEIQGVSGGVSLNGITAQFSLNTVVLPPEIPANFVVTTGDGELSLDWVDNFQFGFTNFIVRRSLNPGGPYTDIATPTESEFVDTGVINDTTYYYVVAAENSLDETSANSSEASGTPEIFVPDPPTIPANLTSFPNDNSIFLNWNDNNQVGFLEFRISRATTPGGPYTQIATTTESNFTDDTVINGTTYYYVVTAVNSDNAVSANSSETSDTPSANITPPNFIFIITDDQDIYSIGAYRNLEPTELDANGQPYVVDTPNIDRLANEGMLFHQARIMGSRSAAVCVGTRTSIMTGRNAWENDTNVNGSVTFPAIFNVGARAGSASRPYATYRTAKIGNSFNTANVEFGVRNDATRRGNTDGSGSEWHGERVLEHIENWRVNHQNNGTPFFMYFGFSHPHDERNARETPPLTTRYGCINTNSPGSLVVNPLAPPLPINHLSATPATFPAHPFDNGELFVRDEINVRGVFRYRNEAVVRNEIGRNFACVDWLDQQMGIVFERLEDPNGDGDTSDSVMDNTYIVFTSDHGMSIGRHGLMGKQNLYDHTWRVPYIVRGPGITPGSRSDALIYLHDTFPTFCDLAGIDVPSSIDDNDGRSFRAVLEGESETHRENLYGMYGGGDRPGIRAITDGRFKLIKYDVDASDTQITQMFDLQTNPFELLPEHGTPNIADAPAYAAIRNQLEATMMSERLRNNDPDAFQGDRTLLRFEGGTAGDTPSTHLDEFAFTNDGTALSGTAGDLPALQTDVPSSIDFVFGQPNTLSLDFEQDLQQHLEIPHNDRAINFGAVPFTIEAWVKLETLPATNDLASAMPVVMKKVIGTGDSELDYMFLAAAGNYGSATTFDRLALHLGNGAIISTLSIPDTEWHHISVAVDPPNDTVRFTLDEQVDAQALSNFGATNTGPVIVGAHFDSSSQIDSAFDGGIDELSITDGFLALAELQPLSAVGQDSDLQISDSVFDFENLTFNLTFTSDETLLYTVERSVNLQPSSWIEVEDFSLIQGAPGANTTTTTALPLLDPSLTNHEFFRIRSGNNINTNSDNN